MAEEEKPGLGSAEIEERRRRGHEARLGPSHRELAKRFTERGGDSAIAEGAVVSVLCHLQQRVDLQPSQAEPRAEGQPAPKQSHLVELLAVCTVHEGLPPERIGRDELLRRVASELKVDAERAEFITHEILASLRGLLNDDEVEELEQQLPHDLLPLWHLPF